VRHQQLKALFVAPDEDQVCEFAGPVIV